LRVPYGCPTFFHRFRLLSHYIEYPAFIRLFDLKEIDKQINEVLEQADYIGVKVKGPYNIAIKIENV